MSFEITDVLGEKVKVIPRIELYTVKEAIMGTELPGLAVVLDDEKEGCQYAVLTVSFGEFIGLKNVAYIDTNNCPFAEELLNQGIAENTGLTKQSGFCTYPLWHFNEDFLKEYGGENYKKYSDAFDDYFSPDEGYEEIDEEGAEMTMGGM